MPKKKPTDDDGPELVKTWELPSSATLGSAVRAKGILQEVQARLPMTIRKSIDLEVGILTLALPETSRTTFRAASATVSEVLANIASLPVIPREIEDILTISTTERHRWLNDGRLPSAGTRTVKLRGRAKKITFHVFEPKVVEDLLDRGTVDEWREEDAAAKLENRRRAAYQAKLTRSLKKASKDKTKAKPNSDETNLSGWEDFDRDGFLR